MGYTEFCGDTYTQSHGVMDLYQTSNKKPSRGAALQWAHENPDALKTSKTYYTDLAFQLERAAEDPGCTYTEALYLENTFFIAVLKSVGRTVLDTGVVRVRYDTAAYAGIITVAIDEDFYPLLEELEVSRCCYDLIWYF